MSINTVSLSGNLTHDPELRQTASGSSVLSFSIAVNERRKNQQTGEWDDYANFVGCVLFGPRAEALAKYMAKGSKVVVSGRLHYSAWEREGQKRSKLEVVVDEIELMTRTNTDSASEAAPTAEVTEVAPPSTAGIYDEDIPF